MKKPVIVWMRQDLRLSDHPAFELAATLSKKVVPCYVLDSRSEKKWAPGSASRWWLHHSLMELDQRLSEIGGRLILKSGDAVKILSALARQINASAVYWLNAVEPDARKDELRLRIALEKHGIEGQGFGGYLLFEPGTIKNLGGSPFRVFTPFWKKCLQNMGQRRLASGTATLEIHHPLPDSDLLANWGLLPIKPDWSKGLRKSWQPGEQYGQALLANLMNRITHYDTERNFPDKNATSHLSPYLHFGNISITQAFEASGLAEQHSNKSTLSFQRELGWREFSGHLLFHFTELPEKPFRTNFTAFPWREDPVALRAWQTGKTGFPLIDAGMRQLWHTGWMHNRVRMVAASFLVKHLLIPWQQGQAWFWDTLVDADLANNAAGWQWIAGCGADAAPYFRIFNPVLQGQKFDPHGTYVKRWVPELTKLPDCYLHTPWIAPTEVLQRAGITLGSNYPTPLIDLAEGRKRALTAFNQFNQR